MEGQNANTPPGYTLNVYVDPKMIFLSRNFENDEAKIHPPLHEDSYFFLPLPIYSGKFCEIYESIR